MANLDLQEKLKQWFNKTGFPLEIETTRAFFLQKFHVEHSAVYPDPETQQSREIDVLALRGDITGIFSILFPIECKTGDKPWVVLTDPDHYSWYSGLSIAIMSHKAQESLSQNVEEYADIYKNLFGQTAYGFSLKQAFSGENDHAYTACMSTLKAAKSLVEEGVEHNRIIFAFPTLIVDTPIYEYSEGPNGEQFFNEVTSSSFFFSTQIKGYSKNIIRIVSNRALADYAEKCRALSDQYRALFASQTKSLFRGGT